jgi:alpha-beta hydrolase superfamily lysophospholipase
MLSRRVGVVLSVGLFALAVTACGDDSPDTSGPYRVGTREYTFVDKERPTPAVGGQPELPDRTLVTDVWYPAEGDAKAAARPDAPFADGPFPLIVFNHGQQGAPEEYALSFETWARAGYVVVAPRHPITVRGGPAGPFAKFTDDLQGEIGDVPFVIDAAERELGDVVDTDEVAVAGHSSGAIVAFANGFDPCCADDRVNAVLVEGLVSTALGRDPKDEVDDIPVMFLHGTEDPYPIDKARADFDRVDSEKVFVTLEGGDHSEAYRTGVIAERASAAALAFFDDVLKNDSERLDDLESMKGIDVTR